MVEVMLGSGERYERDTLHICMYVYEIIKE